MFLTRRSPLILSLLLIFLAISLGGMTWFFFRKWLGVSLFMVFVGGIIVIFLYVSSLAFNEKFFLNRPMPLIFILGLSLFLIFKINNFFAHSLVSQLYRSYSVFSLIFLIAYLLLVFFLAVKLSENFKGALVEKF